MTQRRKHRDPYAIAQSKAKKAANLSRQEVLKKERASELGDPVRGITTPFVTSFDTALPPEPSPDTPSAHTRIDQSPSPDAPGYQVENHNHLNFYLTKEELERGVGRSQWLTKPPPTPDPEETEPEDANISESRRQMAAIFGDPTDTSTDSDYWSASRQLAFLTTDQSPEAREKRIKEEHDTAEEALRRIASLSLGSSKDRLRVNKARCVDVFGRHNTDNTLAPRLKSAVTSEDAMEKTPRAGVDTGSSEVQIAILTAKIRAVADFLDTRGTMDKANKRNLRLLVHRRAKLLKYLRRKDRGGPRWQHLVEKLGLVEGTWKGEITL